MTGITGSCEMFGIGEYVSGGRLSLVVTRPKAGKYDACGRGDENAAPRKLAPREFTLPS